MHSPGGQRHSFGDCCMDACRITFLDICRFDCTSRFNLWILANWCETLLFISVTMSSLLSLAEGETWAGARKKYADDIGIDTADESDEVIKCFLFTKSKGVLFIFKFLLSWGFWCCWLLRSNWKPPITASNAVILLSRWIIWRSLSSWL